jgi:long-chain fatty acid transport protein
MRTELGGIGVVGRIILAAAGVLTGSLGELQAQGFVLSGVGAVNRSMGGAGTAVALDASGPLQWNPAAITAISGTRIDLSVETVFNRNEVSSGVGLGTPFEVSGSTASDAGAAPLPAIGIVLPGGESPFTFGLGLNAIGGFAVNFPADPTNPVLAPPAIGGLGAAYTRFSVLQFAPTIAARVTDELSFGIAPTMNVAEAQARPFPFAPPNDANLDGVFSYPVGIGSQPTWGLGVQAGAYYETDLWTCGFSVKSPQWFQDFKLNAADEVGLPQPVAVNLSYPLILSWGASVRPREDWLVAVDLRYVDYKSTQLFGDPAEFGPAGEVRGLGWKSVFLVAVGTEYRPISNVALRGGYSFNQNPIPAEQAMFSLQAPATYQHLLSLGTTWDVTTQVSLSLTWVHAFRNEVSGPLVQPGGAVPMSRVALDQEVDSVTLGVGIQF